MTTDLITRGLAAKTWATVRASTISVEEFGARTTGNARMAVQRAIDLAVANGIPKVTSRLPRLELWEPLLDDPNGSDLAWLYRNRTLRIPACDSLDLDFGGASVTIKAHTGIGPPLGQPAPNAYGGVWSGGFLTCTGVIGRLRIANVICDGGYTGNARAGENIKVFDKGLYLQDLSDANLGPGNGFGDIIMENVTLHSFSGEIMYDNSSRNHLSRDCHFHTSPQSCWNPNGVGKVVAYNVQAGNSSQPCEIVGGKGHTYFGGRFYAAGGFGSTVIGGPDPGFQAGHAYNFPARRTDAPPPYVMFHGTRFEDYDNYLYLGSYLRGSIETTDVPIFVAAAFASSETLRDIDIDIYATVDRRPGYAAVQVGGAAGNDGSQPNNINIRIHCGGTNLAQINGRNFATGLRIGGFVDPSCTFKVDGYGNSPFSMDTPAVAGSILPLIDTTGFRQNGNPDYLYFAANQTYTVASRSVNLYPTAAGTFNFVLNTAPGYSPDQLFTFHHDGSGAADRIVSFAQNGAGMKLNATRTLRRAGEYLTLRRAEQGAIWVEHAYMGQGA